jgi:Ca2+-binding EF-hand superfamily protein
MTEKTEQRISGRKTVVRTMIVAGTIAALAFSGVALAQQQAAPKPITRAQLSAQLDATFKAVDTNHDGSISTAELQAQQTKELQALQAQARAKLQEDFNRLDTNKDGQLSFAEFSAVASVKPSQTAAQLIASMDTNHDGKVSEAEFEAGRLALFDKIDANHDGVVTPEEVRRATGAK